MCFYQYFFNSFDLPKKGRKAIKLSRKVRKRHIGGYTGHHQASPQLSKAHLYQAENSELRLEIEHLSILLKRYYKLLVRFYLAVVLVNVWMNQLNKILTFCNFQVRFLRDYCTGYARSKLSITSEQLIDFAEKFLEFDAILTPVTPSTPWVSDDQSYWILNQDMWVKLKFNSITSLI